MFLSHIEAKHHAARQRVQEIWRMIDGLITLPNTVNVPGVTAGVRLPFDIRDRLMEVQSRHGMLSMREAIFKSIVLGLATLERLEPRRAGRVEKAPKDLGRVLSPAEVQRIADLGFGRAQLSG